MCVSVYVSVLKSPQAERLKKQESYQLPCQHLGMLKALGHQQHLSNLLVVRHRHGYGAAHERSMTNTSNWCGFFTVWLAWLALFTSCCALQHYTPVILHA